MDCKLTRTRYPGQTKGGVYGLSSRIAVATNAHRAVTAVLLFLLSLSAMPAGAGRYELTKGKGVDVCEAYGTNLNSFKPRLPFRGQRPINPEFKDFSKPDLKGLEDPTGDRSHPADKVDRFLWERDVNPVYFFPVTEWPKWRGTPAQYARAWESYKGSRERRDPQGEPVARLSGNLVGRVDIDNDGVPDNVYLDRQGNDPAGGLGVPLLVLNADRSDIDHEKTKLVMQHPSRKEQGLGEFRKLAPGERNTLIAERFGYVEVEDALHGASYDIFLYKNRAYFDLWWIHHPDYQGKLDFQVGKPLRVFVIENEKTREVCTYKYHRYQNTN